MGVSNCSITLPPTQQVPLPKEYGVTKPLSLAGPMEADIQRTKELEKVWSLRFLFVYYVDFCASVYDDDDCEF